MSYSKLINGWLLSSFSSTYRHVIGLNVCPIGVLQVRNYAARKGTREKAKKKKVKVVIEKVGFIPHNLRKSKVSEAKNQIDPSVFPDERKSDPTDNIWIIRYHKWKVHPFVEAVQGHHETHHPTIYNQPNAPIKAIIELDMQTEKKTKFVNTFTRMVHIPHTFSQPDENRKILAFCKTPEMQDMAKDAGAKMAGGKELIKKIQKGEFSTKEYNVIVSEPTILPDLLLIRGIIKKQFPNIKSGTLNPDIQMLVRKFLTGVEYTAKPHDTFKSYGTIDVTVGTLDMDTKQLEENFSAIVNDVHKAKPRRPEPFIRRILIISPPSKEHFKVDFEQYLPKGSVSKKEETEKEEEEKRLPEAFIASQ
ncbi:hypothetical protein DMN91_012908 [Ooceraea biroi]|uniref:39S ribosomal protein L1, mitochondrial n=1 Tax=Ooceraea biroi TaxID=2015173 RepID=A0A3L8D4G1_OOCBI|nr:uncharacterized protein LOC105280001 isoform X1 [Ooceraea biroi]RLU15021.1 hypothetical protein DMN91_012908 [Ooceraea biroi]